MPTVETLTLLLWITRTTAKVARLCCALVRKVTILAALKPRLLPARALA